MSSNFVFLRPLALWLFIPLCLFTLLLALKKKENDQWKNLIDKKFRPVVILGKNSSALGPILLFLFTMTFLILSLAGPSWGYKERNKPDVNSLFYIAIDSSESMLVKDVSPDRLSWAKIKARSILEKDPKTPTGLLAYAETGFLVLPPTLVYSISKDYLEAMTPKMMPLQGSNLNGLLTKYNTLIDSSQVNTLLIMTDSPQKEDREILQNFLSPEKGNLEILYMPFASRGGNLSTEKGEVFIGGVDKGEVKRIDQIEGVEVIYPVIDESDSAYIVERVRNRLKFLASETEKESQRRDDGLWFLIPALILALFWFRPQFTLLGLSAALFLSCQAPLPSSFKELKSMSFTDYWKTRDLQGQEEYQKGDIKGALDLYEDPFSKGVILFKQGEYKKAIALFSQSEGAKASYNIALCYAQLDKRKMTQQYLEKSLREDPNLALKAYQTYMAWFKALPDDSTGDDDQKNENPEKKESGDANKENETDKKEDRKSETVKSEKRKGKEIDFLPNQKKDEENNKDDMNYIIDRINPDPSEFLRRKFLYQQFVNNPKAAEGENPW